ncbi:hypothetical protein PMKS-001368 [Pichia membranifaciens]|uniref:CCA tRNA nucleotidyltransferase, mitochondrial n=1 Tax=Pichia membranifaciens TaxID=4926 RepID=A0A1Q2YEC0_9ASCO|nr:hypothetical protein PMKS-001368 [Pichia membranifaciens]
MINSFTRAYTPGNIPQIDLTEKEHQIIDILNSYTNYYNANEKDESKRITLRITGGWVRDKLLNHPSHDIDIGIDNCSGESFVMGLKEWLNQNNSEKKERTELDSATKDTTKINTIHKIKKNPDKSKHLETCTTKLCGLDIDFVNLRSELYTEDSRIPTITTGTPVEDAHRRDATLNALFFNLTSMQIEDLTGQGLLDLANGVLRTPLEPTKTFLDDPLRCLRLIRFASNYGFQIEQLSLNAMKQDAIKVALETKISRERIGVEVKKILVNKRGVPGVLNGLELLRKVDFSCIFDLGDTEVPEGWAAANKKHLRDDILSSIENIIKYLEPLAKKKALDFDLVLDDEPSAENDKVLFYSALILNRWGSEKVKVGKRENFVTFFCVLNGIKMPLKIADSVSLILDNMEKTRRGINTYSGLKRSELAKKFVLPFGEKWNLNLLVNYCLECFEDFDQADKISEKYGTLRRSIYELDLQESFKQQVLLNGKDLMKIAEKKPGPWMKPIIEQLFTWQLDNPTCTKEDMIEYLHTII